MPKAIRLFLAAVFLVVFAAGAVWGARVDPQKAMPPLERGDRVPDYLIAEASAIFQAPIHSPYDTILGYTWYDVQHDGSIPRMNANDYQTPRGLHFTFMEMEDPPGNRYVTYAYWDPVSGWDSLPAPRISQGTGRGGFTSLDLIRPLGSTVHSRAVICHHYTEPVFPNPKEYMTVLAIEPNFPGQGAMTGGLCWYDVPDFVDDASADFHGMWPSCGVDSLNRIHVLMSEGSTSAGLGWFGYTRCEELAGDSLECCAPGKGCVRLAKETYYTDQNYEVTVFDTSAIESQIVVASKVSNKVAILWTAPAPSLVDSSVGTMQNCQDIFYIESTNGGDDWQLAGTMPPRTNITKYKAEDPIRSYAEVSGVYDFDDNLHAFWITQGYNQALSRIYPDDIALWHWSKATERYCGDDTLLHNLVTTADWETYPAVGGWNRTITRIQCGIGIEEFNHNYLYLRWSQFDDPDENPALWNAAENFLQADIYITLSTDGGFTWQEPLNITNSAVDHCTSGVCASDHWGSMAERVDTCVYLQWIYDLDAGSMVQDEGRATKNPVLFRALPVDSIPIDTLPRIAWDPESFVDPPMHAPLNGKDTVYLTIENTGSKTLDLTISSAASWLSVDPAASSVLSGGCPLKVELIATAGTQEEFLVDSIRVQSNDETGNDHFWVLVHAVFSDVYQEPEFAIVSNPVYRVSLSNTGNLGHQNDTAGFYLHADWEKPNLLLDGTPLIGFISPDDDTLVGRYIYHDHYLLPATHLSVDSVPDLKTIVAESEFWPVQMNIPPADQYWPWWRIKVENLIFYGQEVAGNLEQYLLLKTMQLFADSPPPWWVELTPPATIPETYLGMALDIDCISETDAYNHPFIDTTRGLAYLRGFGSGTNENYYMGIVQRDPCYQFGPDSFACWPDPKTLDQPDRPYAMHILRNDAFVYPQDGFRNDSLYRYMSTPGYTIYGPGDPADYSVLTTGQVIPAHSYTSSDTHSVAYALIAWNSKSYHAMGNLADMIMCGNANWDDEVGLTDIVWLIGWVFNTGRPDPWIYMCDVNGSGVVDLTDVVYYINYVFKSGPPPRCDYFR